MRLGSRSGVSHEQHHSFAPPVLETYLGNEVNKEIVICSPVRSAIGAFGGSLKAVPAIQAVATAFAEIGAGLSRCVMAGGMENMDRAPYSCRPRVLARAWAKRHPIGATGAILLTKAAHALHRTGQSKAVVSLCIGGGQGIAICFEQC